MAVLLLVTVAAVAIAMYFLGDWLAKPIRLVGESMREVTKGNFTHRIAEQRKDEFGLLFADFDAMAQSLEEREAGRASRPAEAREGTPPSTSAQS
jgi:serine/threonine-protein kinase